MLANVFINNVPRTEYKNKNKFWVVTLCSNELWFYGAFETREKAEKACDIETRFVIEAAD